MSHIFNLTKENKPVAKPGFSRRGLRTNPREATYYLANFSRKPHENEPKIPEQESPVPTLNPKILTFAGI